MTLPLTGPLGIRVVRSDLRSYAQGSPTQMAMDTSGNIYIASYGGDQLTKFDKDLVLQWSKAESATGGVYLSNATVDSSNNIITAGYWTGNNNDLQLQKWSPSGTLLWTNLLTESNSQVNLSSAVDASGNIYTVGYWYDLSQDLSGYIVKYDTLGNYQWNRKLSFVYPTTLQYSQAKVDTSGNIIVVGRINNFNSNPGIEVVKYDPSGQVLYQYAIYFPAKDYSFDSGSIDIQLDLAGDIYISGYGTTLPGPGLQTPTTYLMKFDSSMTLLWAKTQYLSGSSINRGGYTCLDSSGNVFILGGDWSGSGPYHTMYVFKYNSSGVLQYQKNIYIDSSLDSVLGIKVYNSFVYVHYQEAPSRTTILRFPDSITNKGIGDTSPSVFGVLVEPGTYSEGTFTISVVSTAPNTTVSSTSPSATSRTMTLTDSGIVTTVSNFVSTLSQSVSMLDMIREFTVFGTQAAPLYITSQGLGYYVVKFNGFIPSLGNRFFFAWPNENVAKVTSLGPGTGEVTIYSPNYTPTLMDTWYQQNSGSFKLSDFYAGVTGGNVGVPAGTIGYPNGVATPIPSSGNITINNFSGASAGYTVYYTLIGGGGGGGGDSGGGGGGFLSSNIKVSSGVGYSIVIGEGGTGYRSGTAATNGGNTTFDGQIAYGGGHGGYSGTNGTPVSPGSGGSGGGGVGTNGGTLPAGANVSGQGTYGGGAFFNYYIGGGGGGAGGDGGSPYTPNSPYLNGSVGGYGGPGKMASDGNYYAGGGGGSASTGGVANGGGGGAGGGETISSWNGTSGTPNTGGGGGATHQGAGTAGNGGKGIAFIYYSGTQRGTGGTVVTIGSYTYHYFYSSGTYTA